MTDTQRVIDTVRCVTQSEMRALVRVYLKDYGYIDIDDREDTADQLADDLWAILVRTDDGMTQEVNYRETPPCVFCGHREHLNDVCEQDLGEFGECQCADPRVQSPELAPA